MVIIKYQVKYCLINFDKLKMLKKTTLILSIFIIAISQWSCSNELKLIEPTTTSIPIVYGYIDASDSVSYFRIERAFADPITNALTLAKDTAALLYRENELEVKLTNITNSNAKTILKRVDASKEGYPRDKGLFYDNANYLYKTTKNDFTIRGNDEILLTLTDKTKNTKICETSVVCIDPYIYVEPQTQLDSLNISSSSSFSIYARSQKDKQASSMNAYMVIHYAETENGVTTIIDLPWLLVNNFKKPDNSNNFQLSKKGSEFFDFIAANVPVKPNVTRRLLNFDWRVDFQDQELQNYLNVLGANSGVTGSSPIPTYTNIDNFPKQKVNRNGKGLLVSKFKLEKKGVRFYVGVYDILRDNPTTSKLNFR